MKEVIFKSSNIIGRHGNSVQGKCGASPLPCHIQNKKHFLFDDTDQDQTVQKVYLISKSSAMYYQFKQTNSSLFQLFIKDTMNL